METFCIKRIHADSCDKCFYFAEETTATATKSPYLLISDGYSTFIIFALSSRKKYTREEEEMTKNKRLRTGGDMLYSYNYYYYETFEPPTPFPMSDTQMMVILNKEDT